MSGSASWQQIYFLVGVIVTVGIAGFLASWRIQVYLAQDRKTIDQRVDLLFSGLDSRLKAIEVFNAGTLVVLDHMATFRKEVQDAMDNLRGERKEDMERLHRRLDALHNAARIGRPPFDHEDLK